MVKRKKILYIITKSVLGGAGKYVFDLASHASSSNFEVGVAAGRRGALAEKLSAQNIDYFEIQGLGRDVEILSDIRAFFQILKIFFYFKPDILHASSPKTAGLSGLAFFIYKLLKFNFRAKSIYTIHGWVFNEPRPSAQRRLLRNASRLTCSLYNRIIVLAKAEREVGVLLRITPRKKMTVIHNGIDPASISFLPKEEARRALGIPNDCIAAGTIGELTRNKGYEYLVDTAALLRAADYGLRTFIIAWGNKQNLESNIKKQGLENDMKIVNNLSPASLYLKAFDIFVLPSLKEGLPYVLLEAGLSEVPIVATNVGGVPDIVEHEKTGLLVPAANPEALAQAIERLLNNGDLRQTFAKNLREKILREFSQKDMLEKTFALYEKITNGRE